MQKSPVVIFIIFYFVFAPVISRAQSVEGIVTDSTGKPLAFSSVTWGHSGKGIITGADGYFTIPDLRGIDSIRISHTGFETIKISITQLRDNNKVMLPPAYKNLDHVVLKAKSNKLERILFAALKNKQAHNPDNYQYYRCNIYYKLTADFSPGNKVRYSDSTEKAKTNSFLNANHLFLSETYSTRTWEKPALLQENIKAARTSGFQKSPFASLVTDVMPFHSYDNFIKISEKEYRHPLSKEMKENFKFKLTEEIISGKDTTWIISFVPNKKADNLSGVLFINSNNYAISHLTAYNVDTTLKRNSGIEQLYTFADGKWFPAKLKYYIIWNSFGPAGSTLSLTGISLIDSVFFSRDSLFRFDKSHTVKLLKGADEKTNEDWLKLRPTPLAKKETNTYLTLDSIGKKHSFDKLSNWGGQLAFGKIPFKKISFDISRFYSYNLAEKSRIGAGVSTNDRLSKKFSLGAWTGYGTGDKKLKYGAFAEWYADDYKETTIKIGYNNDIFSPGIFFLHKEIDNAYLQNLTMRKSDLRESFFLSYSKKMGFWNTELTIKKEDITPGYLYALENKSQLFSKFNTKELNLGIRYAYGEQTSFFMNRYFPGSRKYPVIYSKLTAGKISNTLASYFQVLMAASWQKHFIRSGTQRIIIKAGQSFSNQPLPLSKLFGANSLANDQFSFYNFGGMLSMQPNHYFSDRFFNLCWKNDFDFNFYKLKITKSIYSSPSLSIGYNMFWGSLANKTAHHLITFNIPDKPFQETGILINRLIRFKYMNIGYLNAGVGYFYPLTGNQNNEKGRFVAGFGFEL